MTSVQENLAGARVIRAFVQEQSEIERFQRLNQEYIHRNLKLIRVWGTFYPLLGTMLGLGGVFVLWMRGDVKRLPDESLLGILLPSMLISGCCLGL